MVMNLSNKHKKYKTLRKNLSRETTQTQRIKALMITKAKHYKLNKFIITYSVITTSIIMLKITNLISN